MDIVSSWNFIRSLGSTQLPKAGYQGSDWRVRPVWSTTVDHWCPNPLSKSPTPVLFHFHHQLSSTQSLQSYLYLGFDPREVFKVSEDFKGFKAYSIPELGWNGERISVLCTISLFKFSFRIWIENCWSLYHISDCTSTFKNFK